MTPALQAPTFVLKSMIWVEKANMQCNAHAKLGFSMSDLERRRGKEIIHSPGIPRLKSMPFLVWALFLCTTSFCRVKVKASFAMNRLFFSAFAVYILISSPRGSLFWSEDIFI